MQNKGIMSVHFIYEITYVVLVQFVLTNYRVFHLKFTLNYNTF